MAMPKREHIANEICKRVVIVDGMHGPCVTYTSAKKAADAILALFAPQVPVRTFDGPLTYCAAGRDGECDDPRCPQERDGESKATGRHCPLDTKYVDADEENNHE